MFLHTSYINEDQKGAKSEERAKLLIIRPTHDCEILEQELSDCTKIGCIYEYSYVSTMLNHIIVKPGT